MEKTKAKTNSAKAKPNKGGCPTAFTNEEAEWLKDRKEDFQTAWGTGKKALTDFWPPLWEEWFGKWPEEDDGARGQKKVVSAK